MEKSTRLKVGPSANQLEGERFTERFDHPMSQFHAHKEEDKNMTDQPSASTRAVNFPRYYSSSPTSVPAEIVVNLPMELPADFAQVFLLQFHDFATALNEAIWISILPRSLD